MMYKAVHLHRSAQSPLHTPCTTSLGDVGGTGPIRFRRYSRRALHQTTSGWRDTDRCSSMSPWLEKRPVSWAAFACLNPWWCRPALQPFRSSRCRFHGPSPYQKCKHTRLLLCREWSCIVGNSCTIQLRLGCIFPRRTYCRRADLQKNAFRRSKIRNSPLT